MGPAGALIAFTGRHGGISRAPWDSLNVALHVDDHRAHVRANRARVLEHLSRPQDSWVSVQQVHGNAVVQVTHGASPHIEADAVITRDRRATLAILVADCVPVLLTDDRALAVAAVHAGWRGTEQRLAERAAWALAEVAGCATSQLHAALGPAIGPCCFAVGAEVASLLAAAHPACAEAFVPRGPEPEREMKTAASRRSASPQERKVAVDLWALNVAALIDAGLPPGHIEVDRTCTACSGDHFSHRRDGAPSGRQAGIIARP